MNGYPTLYQTSATMLPVLLLASLVALRDSRSGFLADWPRAQFGFTLVYLALFVSGEYACIEVLARGRSSGAADILVEVVDEFGVGLAALAGAAAYLYRDPGLREGRWRVLVYLVVLIGAIAIATAAVLI